MIRLLNPKQSDFKDRRHVENFTVACSGGYDSMAALHFFVRGQWKPDVIHVDHATGNEGAIAVVDKFCMANGLNLKVYKIEPKAKLASQSLEEFWRYERIRIFNDEYRSPVITGHNLNDAMETWLFSSMNGQSKLIPYNTRNVYRPFLLTTKDKLLHYAHENNIEWFEDVSNCDVKYVRNRIRHNIMPEVLEINKGFGTMIKKKYLEKYSV